MTIKHELQEAVDTTAKEALRKQCIELVQHIGGAIRDRKSWIKAREQQVRELEDARSDVFKAFDVGDEDAVEQARLKVHKVTQRTTQSTRAPSKVRSASPHFREEDY